MSDARLIDARRQLHWAAQIAAGVGRTLLAARADDSQTAFTLVDGALLQEPVDDRQAGLRLADLTLVCGAEALPLRGRTLDDGFAFLESRFGRKLQRPDVDLPEHPVARGAAFDADPESCQTLGGLYGIAASLLREFAASPVLCWPHHFDIAMLIAVRDGMTIGAGLSPGDASDPEPYWYVTPYPYPSVSGLPPLTRGSWHTEGWVGAVLPALPAGDARAFMSEAIDRCRQLLG